uniref:Uncharacterized protein n=1 Tax=Tanacetum cinerariifolium TaxID=118510 RepID=A0A6L2LJH6_TANCI|nr:hypothetical protein [Tanacetum cinerariifolium]
MGEGLAQPTDTQHTPTFVMPPPKPKKTQKHRQPKRKTIKVPQPSESTDIVADEALHKGGGSGDGPRRQDTMGDTSARTSDEDGLKHIELMKICTTLQKKVLDLEDELKRTKTAQQIKIDSLEKRVKKLKKKHMSRTQKLKRLYKVGLTARVISSSVDEALDKKDTSKQGRINEIDVDEDIALEEVVKVVTTAKMLIDTVVDDAQVTTSIANIPASTYEERSYDSRARENNNKKTTFSQQPQVQDKDDKELAEKLQAEMQAEINEENRLARQRAQKEQEENDSLINTRDDIQAKLDADAQLAQRLHKEE